MNEVFADTLYWVAIARPHDSWKQAAIEARRECQDASLVTTDEVLGEFLTAMSKGGPGVRRTAAKMVREILDDQSVHVISQSREGFLGGLERFSNREDKEYSLTDCISMNVMDELDIQRVLTNDHHFEQEGFIVLIKQK